VIIARLARCVGDIENLRLTGLSDSGAIALHRAFSHARGAVRVHDADFSDSPSLADAGAGALAACIAEGFVCRSLALARCGRLGRLGMSAVAAALPLGALRSLDLRESAGAGGAGATALAAALAASPTLETLVLSDANIGDEGTFALAAALAQPRSMLRELDIARNNISFAGVRAIAKALACGAPALVRLVLNGNSVGDAGAAALAGALAVRCSSRRSAGGPLCLSVRDALVGDAGAVDFAGVLRLRASSGREGVAFSACGEIDLADARTPVSATVALTLIASALRAGARSRVCAGTLEADAAAVLASSFGIALSLAGGGSGSDFNNALTGSARARVLLDAFSGGGAVVTAPSPPSAAALKEAAAAAVRAGARALVTGRELEVDGGAAASAAHVDHGLIANLLRAVRPIAGAARSPPRVTVDLAFQASDALVECSDEDEDDASSGADSEAAGARSSAQSRSPPAQSNSPVSASLAAILPSALLATPLDALTSEQLDAVLALARTLQRNEAGGGSADISSRGEGMAASTAIFAPPPPLAALSPPPLPPPPPLPSAPTLPLPPYPQPVPAARVHLAPRGTTDRSALSQVPTQNLLSSAVDISLSPKTFDGRASLTSATVQTIASAPRATPGDAQSPLPIPRRSAFGRARANTESAAAPSLPSSYAAIAAQRSLLLSSTVGSYSRAATTSLPSSPPSSIDTSRTASPDAWLYGAPLNITM
jgi:hypothetical protein